MELRRLDGLNVPAVIATPADVSRLRREVQELDEKLLQAGLRQSAQAAKLPRLSHLLEELATTNKLDLGDKPTRQHLLEFLVDVHTNAPVVHISFSAEPSAAVLHKIVGWFRQNIHPSILVQVGLQPSIAAGCTLRTTNRYYDFSLRQYFHQKRYLLIKAIEGAG